MIEYQETPPTTAQAQCPHTLRNRAKTECSVCGSIKVNGRWKYLSAPWFAYHADGAPRPVKYQPEGVTP